MLVSGIFKQLRTFVVVPDVLSKFSEIESLFFFREVCDVSISSNYILLSMTDNFSLRKWAKIERNGSLDIHSRLKSIYTCDNSELVNQDARIVWASLISSLEVARYDCLPHHFFANVSTSSVLRRNLKEKSFSTRVWACNSLKLFLFWLSLFHDCPLAGNTRRLFEIFSVIWFGNLCCNYL